MYLIINGTRTNFDRQATEVHELGHTLGLAHSSVGFAHRQGRRAVGRAREPGRRRCTRSRSPAPTAARSRPTTWRRSRSSTRSRRSATTTGTITGTVRAAERASRCSAPTCGRSTSANPAIQLTRVTGFDGKTDGSYTINGVPPGNYDVVVEPLSGDADFLSRPGACSPASTPTSRGVPQHVQGGRLRAGHRPGPRARTSRSARAATKTADFEGRGRLARARRRRHRQHGPRDRRHQDRPERDDHGARRPRPATFPQTAIVTFDDTRTINTRQPRPRPAAQRDRRRSPRTARPTARRAPTPR